MEYWNGNRLPALMLQHDSVSFNSIFRSQELLAAGFRDWCTLKVKIYGTKNMNCRDVVYQSVFAAFFSIPVFISTVNYFLKQKSCLQQKKWCIRSQAVLSASQWLNKQWKILQIAHVCTPVMMSSTLSTIVNAAAAFSHDFVKNFENTKAHAWLRSFHRGFFGNEVP